MTYEKNNVVEKTTTKPQPLFSRENSSYRPLDVLVVDDQASGRFIYERMAQKQGCNVTTASDGVEGYKKLITSSYDLLISDYAMPRLNGLAMMQQVQQHNDKQDYPLLLPSIIYITSEEEIMSTLNMQNNVLGVYLRATRPFKQVNDLITQLQKRL